MTDLKKLAEFEDNLKQLISGDVSSLMATKTTPTKTTGLTRMCIPEHGQPNNNHPVTYMAVPEHGHFERYQQDLLVNSAKDIMANSATFMAVPEHGRPYIGSTKTTGLPSAGLTRMGIPEHGQPFNGSRNRMRFPSMRSMFSFPNK
jgi:hypothetical protein